MVMGRGIERMTMPKSRRKAILADIKRHEKHKLFQERNIPKKLLDYIQSEITAHGSGSLHIPSDNDGVAVLLVNSTEGPIGSLTSFDEMHVFYQGDGFEAIIVDRWKWLEDSKLVMSGDDLKLVDLEVTEVWVDGSKVYVKLEAGGLTEVRIYTFTPEDCGITVREIKHPLLN